jgi:tRNA pseudouridine65 synthase
LLEILFQDEVLVAVNKPHGLLVHRSPIAADADEFAVQLLRDQLGQKVYPVHRLDRKTSGVLLFALEPEINSKMQKAFMDRQIEKTYFALVRGFSPDEGTIDYPLFDDHGKSHEAITHFETIEKMEIPIPFGQFSSSRYSLVKVKPETGRMHQIRRHFAHIFHPIIGDRPHGCNKQNKFFLENWNMNTMLLHASDLQFKHPLNGNDLQINAAMNSEFARMLQLLKNPIL